MDDDGFPHKNALLHLEKELRPTVACAASLVLQENKPDRFVFDMPKLNQSNFKLRQNQENKLKENENG